MRIKIKIGSLDVIESGSIVAQSGDITQISPFSDEEEYSVFIRFNFSEKSKKSVRVLTEEGPKESLIEFTSPFRDGAVLSNAGLLVFAQDDDETVDYLAANYPLILKMYSIFNGLSQYSDAA